MELCKGGMGYRTSYHAVIEGLPPESSTVASIRGATGKACTMTFAARWGTSSGFLSKAISSALVGSCEMPFSHVSVFFCDKENFTH